MKKFNLHLRWDQQLTILGLIVLFLLVGLNQNPIKKTQAIVVEETLALLAVNDLPIKQGPNDAILQDLNNKISAKAVYVYDINSGAVLFEKNAHQALLPASTTKIMTALVANQLYSPQQIFTVNQESLTNGNTMKLVSQEKISAQNLLTGLLIYSANDAAFVLANNHPGGYSGFIEAMNQVALELGLENSYFQNPSGLDQANHHTTARDLTIMAVELLKNQQFKQYVNTKQALVTDISEKYAHYLYNTNELLGDYGVKGVKTGTTEGALQVLVTLVEQNSRQIIIAVMGSNDRYADTKMIIDQIFSSYVWQKLPEF